jgi:EAL domain-containing protein (putative c-di-GMP-specific phosphodiesterase class I)
MVLVAGAALVGWIASMPPREHPPPPAVDTQHAANALAAVSQAWIAELDELAASTRALAMADDTYEFVARPNLPYIHDHYPRERLSAARIDTILIVDRKGTPLFWRRLDNRHNRGFADARAFLAQLPRLTVPTEPGVPALAGAMQLARGPALVIAAPIYPASRAGPSRGWLIAARALDAKQWRRYGERAHVEVEALAPQTAEWPANAVFVPGKAPSPELRVEGTRIRGWLPVYGIRGERLRLFSVTLPAATTPVASPAASLSRSTLGTYGPVALLAALACVLLILVHGRIQPALRPRAAPNLAATGDDSTDTPATAAHASTASAADERHFDVADQEPAAMPAWTDDPDLAAVFDPIELATPGRATGTEHPAARGDAPVPTAAASNVSSDSCQVSVHQQPRATAVEFRYQPQLDLQSGRIAGAEALQDRTEDGPQCAVVGEMADADTAGLELELIERWLREACCERHAWSREVKCAFPVSVPVPRRALEHPAFVTLVRRILADAVLAPELLELEVPEAALTSSPTALTTLEKIEHAGVLICVDGFGNAASSLRSLAAIRISKVRLDAALVRESAYDTRASALVRAIVGAARALAVNVCATGVDTAGQVATLIAHGNLLAQGLAVAAPMEGEHLLARLRESGTATTQLPVLEARDAVRTPPENTDAQPELRHADAGRGAA